MSGSGGGRCRLFLLPHPIEKNPATPAAVGSLPIRLPREGRPGGSSPHYNRGGGGGPPYNYNGEVVMPSYPFPNLGIPRGLWPPLAEYLKWTLTGHSMTVGIFLSRNLPPPPSGHKTNDSIAGGKLPHADFGQILRQRTD